MTDPPPQGDECLLLNDPAFIAQFGERAPAVARMIADTTESLSGLMEDLTAKVSNIAGQSLDPDELFAWFAFVAVHAGRDHARRGLEIIERELREAEGSEP